MARTRRPIKYATPRTPKQKAIRITFHVLVWFGAAILYYVGFRSSSTRPSNTSSSTPPIS